MSLSFSASSICTFACRAFVRSRSSAIDLWSLLIDLWSFILYPIPLLTFRSIRAAFLFPTPPFSHPIHSTIGGTFTPFHSFLLPSTFTAPFSPPRYCHLIGFSLLYPHSVFRRPHLVGAIRPRGLLPWSSNDLHRIVFLLDHLFLLVTAKFHRTVDQTRHYSRVIHSSRSHFLPLNRYSIHSSQKRRNQ